MYSVVFRWMCYIISRYLIIIWTQAITEKHNSHHYNSFEGLYHGLHTVAERQGNGNLSIGLQGPKTHKEINLMTLH